MSPSLERRARSGFRLVANLASLILGAILCHASIVRADALADRAGQMSEQSFALLATLNAGSEGGSVNPLLGPIASFASDTEILKRALASGDPTGQANAVNTLAADCAAVDDGLKANPKALKPDDWKTIRGELDQLARSVAKATAGKVGSAPPAAASTTVVSAPAAPSVPPLSTAASVIPPPAAVVPALPPNPEGAPVVKIESRTISGDVMRIKGYIEGTALKSAGIYQNGQPLRTFQVSGVPGEQKIDLDIGIASPPSGAMLRVIDANGRFAEAPVTASVAARSPSSAEEAPPAEGGPAIGTSTGPLASNEGGVEVFRDTPSRTGTAAPPDDESTVKDIPSHHAPIPSPSRRHTLGGRLANVAINVLGVMQTASAPPSYEVVGQIVGEGVTHAGIYVDGRLIKPLPVEDGDDFTNFDERFVVNGNEATVRAYGAGNQFVESAVDLASGLGAAQQAPPGPLTYGEPLGYGGRPAAPGIGVLITAVRQEAGNLYTVGGTVSGPNIASAGLYQNGVLAQAITLNGGLGGMINGGGGLGSMLGNLLPGTSQSTNFNFRFNPGAGFASIRAYDRTGNYTEQPVMAGGVNPYAGANPYGANPNRAVNPYGTGTNPYGGTTSPYVIGGPGGPPSSSRPLW